jgi:hypothetical protein
MFALPVSDAGGPGAIPGEAANFGRSCARWTASVASKAQHFTFHLTRVFSTMFLRVFTVLVLLGNSAVSGDVAVLTYAYNNNRTGANLNETFLNTGNVNTSHFGLLFTRPVDDQIYAQPLVMTNVDLGSNWIHNIVIIATVNDSVYAYDADDQSVIAPYWQVSFLGPNIFTPNKRDFPSGDAGPCPLLTGNGNAGILGTPVIDPSSGTVYVVARTKEVSGATTNFVQRLHALEISTGVERPNSPVMIAATCLATNSYDATNGIIVFDPYTQGQRAGLALVNGIIYICWASLCDYFKYHGWVMAYDAATLQQVAIYCDTPNGSQGGIWMSGAAPAADDEGNIYLSTGNGTVGDAASPTNTVNRGESFLKLTLNGTNFIVASWFTPYNWATLNQQDLDLNSGGMLLIPGTHLALSASKQGIAYLVDRDNMGGMSLANADTNIPQSFLASTNGRIYGTPVWWDGPDGSYAYVWPANPFGNQFFLLQQYKFDFTNQALSLPAYAQGRIGSRDQSSGALALSANGTNMGTGIIWASQPSRDATFASATCNLYAFDARNITNFLWTSLQNANRDAAGNYSKFVPPTVANGKVYLATSSNKLAVYGLLPPSLSVTLLNGAAIVSWPTNNYPGYRLQTSASLISGSWTDVTNNAALTNGLFQVMISPVNAAGFYRLKL